MTWKMIKVGALGFFLTIIVGCYPTDDWLCQCTITDKWGDVWTDYEIITNQSERDASAICNTLGDNIQQGDPEISSVSCTINRIE
ncbi:MAG: hypothetical protein GXO48_02240 [Chlorobi bacterium]|nr:hypothetical protein [Chlorobiota bacterium]